MLTTALLSLPFGRRGVLSLLLLHGSLAHSFLQLGLSLSRSLRFGLWSPVFRRGAR